VFVVWGVVAVLCLPEIVLLVVAAITGSALVGWIAVVVGIVLGVVFALLGIRQGGRLLDRRGPALLEQLRVAA
jgi:ABC-2 type transport system permease protein